VSLQTAEAFSASSIAGKSIPITFAVAADLPHHRHQALDRVGAPERAPQSIRQTEADNGEHFIQSFED
jgi:hypothetical protein